MLYKPLTTVAVACINSLCDGFWTTQAFFSMLLRHMQSVHEHIGHLNAKDLSFWLMRHLGPRQIQEIAPEGDGQGIEGRC